jgi:TRAP-type C4-dicarboxylate transport system permease small subunit
MDGLYRLCIWLAGFCLLFMTFIYVFAIYARFRPDWPAWLDFLPYASTSWPEPLSLICMRTFSFVGAAAAYRAGGHIAVTMVTDNVSPKVREFLRYAVDICMLITCVLIVVWGFDNCAAAWHDIIPSLPMLTAGMTYLPIPTGSLLTAFFVVERLIAGPQSHRELVQFGSPKAGH